MLLRNISQNISRLRDSKNMSQKELAENLYVTHQAVSKWEKGKSIPSIEVMIELTKIFNVSIDSLLIDPNDETDFKQLLNDYERNYCVHSLLKGELNIGVCDVFYLLNEEERELIIFSILNKEFIVNIIDFWPLLNVKERLVFLRGLIRNNDHDSINSLKGMFRASELAILKNMKESIL